MDALLWIETPGNPLLSVSDIADRQNIPLRFLETILGQMKQAGFVVSRRGSQGGYLLARPAEQLTVGQVLRYIGGPLGPVACADENSSASCGLDGSCALSGMWKRVHKALAEIYDSTTLASLVEEHRTEAGRLGITEWSMTDSAFDGRIAKPC